MQLKELYFYQGCYGNDEILGFGLLFLFKLPFYTQFLKIQIFSRMIVSNQQQDPQDVSLGH